MVLKIFSVRDSKGEIFGQPFFQKTPGEAERSFKMLVNDSQSIPSKYPEDFDLYYIGQFDDQSGKVQPIDTPMHIVKAIALKDSTLVQ